MRLVIGEVLGLNRGLAEGDKRGRTITPTVCVAAHGKVVFLLNTVCAAARGKVVSLLNTSEPSVLLGGRKVALLTNGG